MIKDDQFKTDLVLGSTFWYRTDEKDINDLLIQKTQIAPLYKELLGATLIPDVTGWNELEMAIWTILLEGNCVKVDHVQKLVEDSQGVYDLDEWINISLTSDDKKQRELCQKLLPEIEKKQSTFDIYREMYKERFEEAIVTFWRQHQGKREQR